MVCLKLVDWWPLRYSASPSDCVQACQACKRQAHHPDGYKKAARSELDAPSHQTPFQYISSHNQLSSMNQAACPGSDLWLILLHIIFLFGVRFN